MNTSELMELNEGDIVFCNQKRYGFTLGKSYKVYRRDKYKNRYIKNDRGDFIRLVFKCRIFSTEYDFADIAELFEL